MIRIEDVTFTYAGRKKPAIRNVNLDINRGEFILVVGASGSGKSTLLRLLNGLIPHFYEGEFRGRVLVDGVDTRETSVSKLSRKIGLVFQNPDNQIVTLHVKRELAFGLENIGMRREEIEKRIRGIIKEIHMERIEDKYTDELSGGEKQLLAIAATLAMEPDIIVLDEPTSELDTANAMRIAGILRKVHEKGKGVIVSEHRLDLFIPLADRIVVIDDGVIVADGPAKKIVKEVDFAKHRINEPLAIRIYREVTRRGISIEEVPLGVKDIIEFLRKVRGN
ncbi:MAG: ABC transporter ATP-binding protein [Thermoproteota archaeon]|jgi:energy-coupling factor transporter ATP-binding protein EcfA2|uniref:ABC transporter ATP-binding protein n=1 Tax=Candidatus Methanodesulfokora washburnensis TaxID=2478471 RepID=A0A3R9RM96_9CREN|nr:ABC transporter ATP-binding protein [Candidatus Methanodesulfokores washburnensis]RSN73594.1 ABC transporter ATP-binding protein [Candidatus Methanodesulfokores washburnensis]RZN58199.1 MAG: ABC transporter ATP-binding protein [Candidatus Methanodesulfokores washburnensis]TDA39865.1 MAG: ABC transporter ATP-binding protein [Candidatus Korarchaeota archaeon]